MAEKWGKVCDFAKKLGEKFLEELYPSNFSCYACSNEIDSNKHQFLCDTCLSKIEKIDYSCKRCGEKLNSFTNFCKNCKEAERFFDKSVSFATFDGVAKYLVYKLKYGKARYIASAINIFLCKKYNEAFFKSKIDFVIPVPLSKQRLKERGFNQAQLLGEKFASANNLLFDNEIIERTRDTLTQTSLSKEERRENLKDAFKVIDCKKLKNKTVLIVDDVFTTGATLDEMAKVLKKAGAKVVYGLTFCHA